MAKHACYHLPTAAVTLPLLGVKENLFGSRKRDDCNLIHLEEKQEQTNKNPNLLENLRNGIKISFKEVKPTIYFRKTNCFIHKNLRNAANTAYVIASLLREKVKINY
jgi:hypothetical protein